MSPLAGRVASFREALETVLREAAVSPLPEAEQVPLMNSAGRVLAEPIAADRDQPPFDRATRDGFAVRAEEWSAAERLRLAGLVRAGETWRGGVLHGGEAIEIMTGAPVPAGADAVGMIEHATQADGEVWAVAGRTLRAGENIVPRGSEARTGDVVLQPGVTMRAAEIALAAACGCTDIMVYRPPRVAVVATGDELVEIIDTPATHQIRNSNSYALAALVAAAGGEPVRLPVARDTREDLRARIVQAGACELLLLSGGVSAGKYDLVEDVLAEFGAEPFFTGVKMQPGKPVVFGRMPKAASQQVSESESQQAGGEWIYFFALPGNPVSTEVTFHCFVTPLLRALCGANQDSISPRFAQATLAENVSSKAGMTRLLPARLTHSFDKPEVRLVPWQGSGDLAANARANCYAVLPDGHELRGGDVVTVLLR